MLIHNKDDIEFVTEFPCFLGHPVGIEQSARVNTNICDGGMTFFCLIINNYLSSIIIYNF